jgi:SAM-dependent methyltransferase
MMPSLEREARSFGRKLDRIKAELKPSDFSWYPYESLKSFAYTVGLLGKESRCCLDRAANGAVLDVGCGDGDVAFFLESLGSKVTAIDHPSPNWNKMRGVKLLEDALHSSVEVREVDLDSQFMLGDGERYELTLFLGILYHLQNPFFVLTALAKHSNYCFLNTRVARFTPNRRCHYHGEPMAYLVDVCEVNNDATNYWIFSEAGLRRILKRTGWEVCEFISAGNTTDSDPVSNTGDERAIVLLRSALV